MINRRIFSLLILATCTPLIAKDVQPLNAYQQEFQNFKNQKEHQYIFDKDANQDLKDIQRKMINFKETKDLSFFQRIFRNLVLRLDVVIVSPNTMPTLHAYIDGICKQANIRTPLICITTQNVLFNALALKLFTGSGMVLIGQKLLNETSTKELEAILAHEIGHIKHNHNNKILPIYLTSFGLSLVAMHKLVDCVTKLIQMNQPAFTFQILTLKVMLASASAQALTSLIINKKFEKEADEFAYKDMNKGEGLIEFFEHLKAKEEKNDNEFIMTEDLLNANANNLDSQDYHDLMIDYDDASLKNTFNKWYRWIYHNTPFGPHPSHEARIDAVQEYLNAQA